MRIAVIGAGVIGLTSAVTAQQAGHQVAIYADRAPERTTSARAAACVLPHAVAPNALADALLRETWERYVPIARDHPESGVRLRTHWEAASWVQERPGFLGVMRDVDEVLSPHVPGGYAHAWRFSTYFIDVPVFLPWLVRRFLSAGGSMDTGRHFASMTELAGLPADAVLNCTGLGARELCGDRAVLPIKGQTALLPPRPDLDWSHHADGFYMFPRSSDTLLGGTTEWRVETETPDPIAVELIVRGNARLLGEIALGSVKATAAGLRPYREGSVRVEVEDLVGKRVVHNYGHGGSGYTLAWGSAAKAVALLGERPAAAAQK